MRTENPGLIITRQPTVAITKHKLLAVDGTLANAVRPLGVALEDGVIGEDTPIAVSGVVLVEVGGVVASGDLLIAANGQVDTNALATVADLSKNVGLALDSGAVAGDLIRVKLN